MEINALNSLQSAKPLTSTSEMDVNDSMMFGYMSGNYDENKALYENTRATVTSNLKGLRDKVKLNDAWYHSLIGNDHIILEGDGSLTYGKLREMLGIPPRALSSTNKGNFKDSDLIQGSIMINLNDIGYYERIMDSQEAMDVRAQRRNGEYKAGYEKTLTNKEIIDILKGK